MVDEWEERGRTEGIDDFLDQITLDRFPISLLLNQLQHRWSQLKLLLHMFKENLSPSDQRKLKHQDKFHQPYSKEKI